MPSTPPPSLLRWLCRFVTPGWLAALLYTIRTIPSVGMAGPLFIGTGHAVTEAGGLVFDDAAAANYGRNMALEKDVSVTIYMCEHRCDYKCDYRCDLAGIQRLNMPLGSRYPLLYQATLPQWTYPPPPPTAPWDGAPPFPGGRIASQPSPPPPASPSLLLPPLLPPPPSLAPLRPPDRLHLRRLRPHAAPALL